MGPDLLASVTAAAVLAAGTLVSEDLTCITAGALVADRRLGFPAAVAGCFAGILSGDLLLFLGGRRFGRRLLALPLLSRLVTDAAIERSSSWLRRRGAAVVLITRLVPGTRLPTYVAAGMLRTDGWKFAVYVALAAAIWTPLLVGATAVLSAEVVAAGLMTGQSVLARVAMMALALAVLVRMARAVLTWPRRRRLFARWQRLTRWEFWPPYLFYPPLVAYVVLLMIRHRSVTVFTAANPGIPGGGFIAESKIDILRSLGGAGDRVARAALIPGDLPLGDRRAAARRFIDSIDAPWPVVLKPNHGQRGSGVVIVRTMEALARQVSEAPIDLIVQEYAPGHEFGVFYCRRPWEARGRILSMAEKRFLSLTGDGCQSIADLILADDRAVCLEHVHRRAHAGQLDRIPGAGESVQLVQIGSHCRGALFLDARSLVTPALEEAVDSIARHFEGFYFGRFDVRTRSIADFREGRNFKIVELNGVTSEAAHIYDPGNSLLTAYRALASQWRLAFEIGVENRRRGAMPAPIAELLRLMLKYRRLARLHPEPLRTGGPASSGPPLPAADPTMPRNRGSAASLNACSGLMNPPEIPT